MLPVIFSNGFNKFNSIKKIGIGNLKLNLHLIVHKNKKMRFWSYYLNVFFFKTKTPLSVALKNLLLFFFIVLSAGSKQMTIKETNYFSIVACNFSKSAR